MNKKGIETTLGIYMKIGLRDTIVKRAGDMGVSTSKFCRTIIEEWLDSGKKLNISE